MLGLFGGHRGSGEPLPLGSWPNWWAGLIQLVCGLLVGAGPWSLDERLRPRRSGTARPLAAPAAQRPDA
ncbi:hypothetical protein RB614_03505 [Phytohabitans sp. ZYX-F-186]|uniref:Uncharacterized protein n=1 Tax=Phytohabitans maris TaxID=3071409 RepID=A0ABU0ZAW3_9ACTN|nr:hypothetical protein [Phytohabitans sp. ZYX-F-186]MDQ7903579.1 hypothetical protein [Phytohabitans sp. ZYX-F-186]